MFLEIILGIIVSLILMYLFFTYLKWSNDYYSQMNQPKADSTYSFLLPPRCVSESYKVITFWLQYYWITYTMKL